MEAQVRQRRSTASGSTGFRGLAVALLAVLTLLGSSPGVIATPPAAEAREGRLAGRTLSEALLELASGGLQIVFTSGLVRPEMRVETEPVATDPRQILEEILAPHGLTVSAGPEGTLVVVPLAGLPLEGEISIGGTVRSLRDGRPLDGATVRVVGSQIEAISDEEGSFDISVPGTGEVGLEASFPGYLSARLDDVGAVAAGLGGVEILLDPVAVIEDELMVTPSRVSLLREEPVGLLGLTRDEITSLPHLGGDLFRALGLLPGVVANDVSAEFHARGGRRDETQILFDGQELYEAFHLKDFDSALSLVAPGALDSAELTTGGFPARYGDRMSAVLDMVTVTPTGPARFRLGAGILDAHAGGAGAFPGERGSWLVEARRGAIDLVARLIGNEDPRYWDAFAKVELDAGRRQSVAGSLLHSEDRLEFEETGGGDSKDLQTAYNASYLWSTHQGILGSDHLVETAVSLARIDRDRRGFELEEDLRFIILDERDTEVYELRQVWSHQLTARHSLRWGWGLREFETEYDYAGDRLLGNPLAVIRHDFGEERTVFAGSFGDRSSSAHLTDRLRVMDRLTLETGLRYDRHTLAGESLFSPRINLAWAVGNRGVLRASWGRFNQSQRTYELQVEDGEQTFFPVERSDHLVAGFERLFRARGESSGLALRVEAYSRRVANPRPRFQNLFEPINIFPEVEPDRVRIAPERAAARGVELFLRGGFGPRVGWWVNYVWAETEDRIDGGWIPRSFDQTHAVNLDLDLHLGENWRLNLAWRYHTGWPTTPLGLRQAEDGEGEIVYEPVLGPLNSERLGDYHRLDLRASRRWRRRSALIDFFVDVQNVYNRKNLGGFDIQVDEEAGELVVLEETWAGTLPSAGVSIRF